MIEIKNLSKSFSDKLILDDINLKINEGEIFGLIGESGAGKSTLLNCINKLEEYDDGNLSVDLIDVKDLSKDEIRIFRKNIGMIFQNFSLINRKNVFQNIALPMQCWGFSKEEINKRVLILSKKMGIEDKIYAKPSELSGGQKQRVAIARALALNPKYLLCDEATSALDPKTTKSILKLLKDINKEMNITIVIVTHEMDVVQNICDKIAILEKGKIVSFDKTENLFLNKPLELRKLLAEEISGDVIKNKLSLNININTDKENTFFYDISKKIKNPFNLKNMQTYKFSNQTYQSFDLIIELEEENSVIKFLNEKDIRFKVDN